MIFDSEVSIWLSNQPTDMRQAVNGLSKLVVDHFNSSPQNGDAFIFYNRSRKMVKILFWHFNGFCILYKRLESETFKIPQNINSPVIVNKKQFSRLLDGLNFINTEAAKENIFY